MRVERVAVAVVVGVGVLAAPVAHASSARPACDLVTDAPNDVMPAMPAMSNSDYDIRSADIATDKRKLTAVIRLSSLAPEDTASIAARDYEFQFGANGHTFGLQASLLTGGVSFEAVVYDTSEPGAQSGTDLAEISGVIDSAHHEIRITAPLSTFAPYATFKQTYIDQLYVMSARAIGAGDTQSPDGRIQIGSQSAAYVVDTASSTARYVPGRPSCVRVGK